MATKNYMINDKWLDLDKQNIVELQSVDGVLDSLKVNGSEIETPSGKITITENGTDIDIAQYALADVNVEGGGGSSDFSTAEVTIVNNTTGQGMGFSGPFIAIEPNTDTIMPSVTIANNSTRTYSMVLYKGVQEAYIHSLYDYGDITVSGDIEQRGDYLIISGDGTITISVGE